MGGKEGGEGRGGREEGREGEGRGGDGREGGREEGREWGEGEREKVGIMKKDEGGGRNRTCEVEIVGGRRGGGEELRTCKFAVLKGEYRI